MSAAVLAAEAEEKANPEMDSPVQGHPIAAVYVNSAQVLVGPWDLTIVFGQVIGRRGDNLLVDEKASVVMSLHHAKALVDVLSKNLAEYEKRAGEVKWKLADPQM